MPARKKTFGKGDDKARILEKCPLCHSEAQGEASAERGFWRSVKTSTCPVCGALFVHASQGRYRLRSCDPGRLSVARGKRPPRSGCAECSPALRCYLGMSLSESDWRRVEKGEPTESEKAIMEQRSRLEAGELPVLSPERSPVPIEEGEQLHHVATVYTCEQPLPGESRDQGMLVVTSRRIVLLHGGDSLEIGLDEIDRLETAFPGFLVYTKGSSQPFCFFPHRADPVYYAVRAALRKSRGEPSSD